MSVDRDPILLILDLDETLIFATEDPLSRGEDFHAGDYYVYRRPFLGEFLDLCFRLFQVAVWTSSNEGYAETIARHVFGERELAFLWARNRCTRRFQPEWQEYYWVKDLKKVRRAGHDLNRVLVVDDTPRKHERNYGNFIRVREYHGEIEDRELKYLAAYLPTLTSVASVRTIEKRTWRSQVSK